MVDFTRPEHTVGRAQLFFGVMAYPELGAGASEGAQGAKFASALGSYFTWAVRQQYGLAALREREISPEQKEHWEGILRRGGRRIRRRVNSLRIWRAATFPKSPNGGDASLRAEFFRIGLEKAHSALRLDAAHISRPEDDASQEELIRQLRAAVNESKPVFHMVLQLENACPQVAKALPESLPPAERLSWRYAFLRNDLWLEDGIRNAERWRKGQHGWLRPSDMIELRS